MADEKKISDLLSAPDADVDENTLVEVSTEDNGSYSSYKGALGALFDKILRAVQFTQRLNTQNKTVFGAINEIAQGGGGGGGSSTLSGLTDVDITTPSNGQVLKYDSTSQKWENAEESGGSANIVECTQAQYDAWEQAGTLDPDTAYFINDGNIGSDIIDDSSTAQDKVWSAYKTDGVSNMAIQNNENIYYLSDDLASRFDLSANYAVGDYCLYNKILYRFTSAKSAGLWDSTKVTSVNVTSMLPKLYSDSLTTDSSGFISVQLSNKYIPLQAWAAQGDHIVIPFASVNGDSYGSNKWWFKVTNENLQPRTSSNINFYMIYIQF